jgi:hypothetical protein
MEPLDMRNARGFDGLGRVGGLSRKTRRLGDQSVLARRVAWEGRGVAAGAQRV